MKLNFIKQSVFFLLIIGLSACNRTSSPDVHLDLKLKEVDSLISHGDRSRVLEVINSINVDDYKSINQKVSYYLLSAVAERDNEERAVNIAKEALLLFDNPEIIKEEQELYFKTLVTNGDLNYNAKNYLTALNYLAEAKSLIKSDDCQNGFIFGKFANIFFDQRDYATAAKYYLESYKMTVSCNPKGKVKTSYYFPGMSLNNAGFSFFKNNQLDSAAFYYQKFNEKIDSAFAKKEINPEYVSVLKAILYDNLGGLYIERGDFELAQFYLQKSLALPVPGEVSIKLPPYLKLARIYTETGENQKALEAFENSKILLDSTKSRRFTYNSIWQKQYATYLKKNNQLDSAYIYEEQYFNSLDSLNKNNQKLSALDVTKELEVIRQRHELNKLRHNDQVRRIYVAGLIEFLVLVIIIIALVYRNLRKVKKLHEDALESNKVITATVAELERANKNYIRIMRVMAHDLRNPLSGMAGIASVLLYDDELDDESKKMLKLIETTGLHSIEMINELLKTGLSDEDAPIETQYLDLKALLYDSVELLQFKANEKQQTIIFENKDLEPVFARINYEKVWRVINNLLVNAIKFSLIGGEIKTGVKDYKSSIVIYVKDNGIGIAEKDKETVFDMFTHAKKTGTNGEQPFGLGLSISRKIMEKHHGKIWFVSNDGEDGTTFFLEFPKASSVG